MHRDVSRTVMGRTRPDAGDLRHVGQPSAIAWRGLPMVDRSVDLDRAALGRIDAKGTCASSERPAPTTGSPRSRRVDFERAS